MLGLLFALSSSLRVIDGARWWPLETLVAACGLVIAVLGVVYVVDVDREGVRPLLARRIPWRDIVLVRRADELAAAVDAGRAGTALP